MSHYQYFRLRLFLVYNQFPLSSSLFQLHDIEEVINCL